MSARILRLNIAGHPVEWLSWQEATCLYSRGVVIWALGDSVKTVYGGISKLTGQQSRIELQSIIACAGEKLHRPRLSPPLNNTTLFRRDLHTCMYCGECFKSSELTRDHIVPRSRGGKDRWTNVTTACKRCNQRKGNRLLEESGMELLTIPYMPNNAEWLALVNSDRIRGDQMEFLSGQFSPHCRWATRAA